MTDLVPGDQEAKELQQDNVSLNPNLGQAKSNLFDASGKDPNKEAEKKKLAQESGLPVQMFDQDNYETERLADYKRMLPNLWEADQATLRFLARPENARIAKDDIPKLIEMEKKLAGKKLDAEWEDKLFGLGNTAPVRYARSLYAGVVADFAGLGTRGTGRNLMLAGQETDSITGLLDQFSVMNTFIDAYLASDIDMKVGDLTAEQTRQVIKGARQDTQGIALSISDTLVEAGRTWEEIGDEIYKAGDAVDVHYSQRNFGNQTIRGIGMILATVGTNAIPVVGRPIAQSAFFGMGSDDQYERQLQAGLTPTLKYNLLGGSMVTASEEFGLDFLLDRLPPLVKNKFLNYMVDFAVSAGGEAFQELTENIAMNAVETLYNDKAELFDVDISELMSAGIGAGVVRTLLRAVGSKQLRMNRNSQTEQDKLQELIDLARESKLNERDPEAFAEFVNTVSGEHSDVSDVVYFDAEALNEIIDDLDQGMPIVEQMRQQLQEALDVKGDVVISMADFLSQLTNDGALELLRPHVRMSEDTSSQAELAEMTEEQAYNLSKLLEDGLAEGKYDKDAKEIETFVAEMIYNQGRMSRRHARISAKVISARAVAFAKRKNMSVKEAWDRMQFQVQRGENYERTTRNGVMYEQNFGDMILREDVVMPDGTEATMENNAQELWDKQLQKAKNIDTLMECMDG